MALKPDDPRRCKATSKQSGQQCGRAAVPGLAVCVMHGGKTQASQEKARRIIAEASEIAALAMVKMVNDKTAPHAVRVSAAKDIMDRGGLKPKEEVSVELSKFEQIVARGEVLVDLDE